MLSAYVESHLIIIIIYIIKIAQFDFLSVSRAQSTIPRATVTQNAIMAR